MKIITDNNFKIEYLLSDVFSVIPKLTFLEFPFITNALPSLSVKSNENETSSGIRLINSSLISISKNSLNSLMVLFLFFLKVTKKPQQQELKQSPKTD